MKQVRVTAVNGRKVQAAGKWLTTIGNRTVSVGDLVWTDGKCVYGHSADTGGDSAVMSAALSGIPLLKYPNKYLYYRKGKIENFGEGDRHFFMLNQGNRIAFFEDVEGRPYDADMDSQGNVYSLHARQIYADWDAYPSIAFKQGEIVVKRNGEVFSECNIEPFIYPIVDEAMNIAETSLDSHTSGEDHVDATTMREFFSMFWNGHIDEKGNYQLLTYVSLTAQREDSCMVPDGRDEYRSGYVGYCELTKWFMFDGKNIEEWSQVVNRGCYAFSYGWYPVIHNDWRVTDERFAQDHSVKVMLNDGIYATVGNLPSFCKNWAFSKNNDLKFYNAGNEFLCSIVGNPGSRMSVCPISAGKNLILSGAGLYLWDNSNLTDLATSIYNLRLRKMPNLRKFRKAGNAQKSEK